MSRKYAAIIALAVVAVMAMLAVVRFPNDRRRRRTMQTRRRLSFEYSDFQDEEYYNEKDLRLVTFGTSRGYGSGLADPAKQCFTGLLNGTNLAIRASTADYPALCAYSMLQEEVYDVIIIEYLPQSYSHTRESLTELGKRVRQRFPDALIIYVDIWSNHQFHVRMPGNNLKTPFALAEKKAIARGLKGKDRQSMIETATEYKQTPWIFHNEEDSNWLREAVSRPPIDAQVLTIKRPEKGAEFQAFKEMIEFYLDDGIHFSNFGHDWVRREILKIIREAKQERSDRLNPWASEDKCENWIQTGRTSLITNMGMIPFSHGKKFALHSYRHRMARHKEPNFIELENDSGVAQHLYVSHMASGPHDFYGGGHVEIRERAIGRPAKYNVTFSTIANYTTWAIHVIKHDYIGKIEPGRNYVVIENIDPALEEIKTTGLIMTPAPFVVNGLSGNTG